MTDNDYRELIAKARNDAWRIGSIINPPYSAPLGRLGDGDMRADMARKLLTQLEVIDADDAALTAAHAHASAATLALLSRNTADNAQRAFAAATDVANILHDYANALARAHGDAEWTDQEIRATQLSRLTDFLVEEFAEARGVLRAHISEYVGIDIDDHGELSGGAEDWIDAAWAAATGQIGNTD